VVRFRRDSSLDRDWRDDFGRSDESDHRRMWDRVHPQDVATLNPQKRILEKRQPSVRRRVAIEDSIDGMEVYASSFGEVFKPIRSPKGSAMIQTSQIGDSSTLMFIAYLVSCPKRS
jgi:hypothetical protein